MSQTGRHRRPDVLATPRQRAAGQLRAPALVCSVDNDPVMAALADELPAARTHLGWWGAGQDGGAAGGRARASSGAAAKLRWRWPGLHTGLIRRATI